MMADSSGSSCPENGESSSGRQLLRAATIAQHMQEEERSCHAEEVGVLGGALGQGKAAAAALEGISRNPGAAARIQTPMILGLALIESLVLLSFVIAFFLQGFAAAGK
jgi:F0F1-type ATP synthase membrane subunit c/vacuolar-type H+-ATPase subunit K